MRLAGRSQLRSHPALFTPHRGLSSGGSFLSLAVLTSGFCLGFDCLALGFALAGYFDSPCLGLLAFRECYTQHAIAVLGRGSVSGNGLRQGERARKRTISSL